MNAMDHAGDLTFSLYSDADFVAKMAEDAGLALKRGDGVSAMQKLESARRNAELVEMRLNDAIRAIEKAQGL